MYAVSKKIFLALVVMTVVLTIGAWQATPVIPASQRGADSIEAPLFPGLTWSDLGVSSETIRTSINGDSFSLPGNRYEAQEHFLADTPLPQNLLEYYSNQQLGRTGWTSYDTFDTSDGVHYVFSNESGAYLSVEFLKCQDDAAKICIAVWLSNQGNHNAVAASAMASTQEQQAAASTFGKISPSNGTTNLNPVSVKLTWDAYSPSPDKYSYCVQEGSACATNDPDWTSTYDTNVTLSLGNNKTYYWQVKAITCVECTPKTVVYANGGTAWYFKTSSSSEVTILGNAGLPSAVLSYVVNGTNKTFTADSTGAYSFKVPYNWSGTVTPSKSGYMFTPSSATFTNLTASQTIQNFAATLAYTISGNAGKPGVTLSYTDIIAKTVVSDSNGNYTIAVPVGWTGSITPSLTNYTFSPTSRTYTNLAANQTGQNYTAALITYAISGNVGVGGVTLSYTDTTAKTVLSNGDGSYSLQVSNNWSGTVTPSHVCYTFTPLNKSYVGVTANQINQNYTSAFVSAAGCAEVNVKIAENTVGNFGLPSTASEATMFPGVTNGPVKVTGTTSIFTSQRAVYGNSFNELSGFPANQLTTDYWFPYYDDVNMSTWLMIGNPDPAQSAHVEVYIGNSSTPYTYDIPHGQSVLPKYKIAGGPVEVKSTNGVDIFTSQRAAYGNSFNELMGFPADQLTTNYWFPYYDDVNMSTWLMIGNPDPALTAHVEVYIGNSITPYRTYDIPHGESILPKYQIAGGPVQVKSTNGVDIFTSQRAAYGSSFNELMGFPANQLTTDYWFTYYDDVNMSTWLMIGNPDPALTAHVEVYIGNSITPYTYDIPHGQSVLPKYSIANGPVRVKSTNGVKIFTSQRVAYGSSFNELMGFPANKLTTSYWFTYYDDVSMSTWLMIGKP
jgi:hypothetical protein